MSENINLMPEIFKFFEDPRIESPSWDELSNLLEKHFVNDLSHYNILTDNFCSELLGNYEPFRGKLEFTTDEKKLVQLLMMQKYGITACENCGYYKKSKKQTIFFQKGLFLKNFYVIGLCMTINYAGEVQMQRTFGCYQGPYSDKP